MQLTNSNCLEGLACPRCFDEGPFKMAVTIRATVLMSDDGTEEEKDSHTTWADSDYCKCLECGYEGAVQDFKEGAEKRAAAPGEEKSHA